MGKFHEPVLLTEAIENLNIKKGEKYIDATLGGGGHSKQILDLGGKVLGIDCDPEAIKAARKYLSSACPPPPIRRGLTTSWQLARGNFGHLKRIAEKYKFTPVAGVFFDLGVSSYQLEKSSRGFSFNREGPLDMRMDPDLTVTAADLVNGLTKGELNELFYRLGEEYDSRRIAEAVCYARRIAPITTCSQLAKIISEIKSKKAKGRRIHPATKCFLALRIAVNDEFNNLKKGLSQALEILKPQGRLAVISFHSGEDRIVKQFLKQEAEKGSLEIITKKPVVPSAREVKENPRSRSAKLRVAEK